MLINPKFSRARMTVGSWGAVPDRGDEGLSDASFQKTLEVMRQDGHSKFRVENGTYWLSQNLEFDIDDIEFFCPDGAATIYQKTYGKNVARLTGKRPRVRRLDLRSPYTGVNKTRISNGNISLRYQGEFRRQEASALILQCDDPLIENVITRNFVAGIRWIGGQVRFYQAAAYAGQATTLTAKLNDSMGLDANGNPLPDGFYIGARFLMRGTTGGNWANVVLVTGYNSATNTITWTTPQVLPSGTIWLYLVMGQSAGGVVHNHRSYGEDFSLIFQFLDGVELSGTLYSSGVVKSQGAPPHGLYGSGSIDGIDDSVDAEADITPDMPAANEVKITGVLWNEASPEHMAYKIRNAGRVILSTPAVAIGSRACMVLEMVGYASGASKALDAKTTSGNNRPSALEFYDVKRLDWKAHLELASDYVWSNQAAALPAVVAGSQIGRGRTPVDINLEISGVFRGNATTQYGLLITNTSGYPNIGNITLRKANLRAENSYAITLARIFNTNIATIGDDIDLINVDASTGATLAVQSRVLFEATCLAGLLTYNSGRTQGAIAMTDEGQATTVLTANAARDTATEGSSNILGNGRFSSWVNTNVSAPMSNTIYETATGWLLWRSSAVTDWTATQQAGMLGADYSLQYQRGVGTSSTARMNMGYQLPGWFVQLMAGKQITLLVGLQAGPNWSGGALQAEVLYGTAAGAGLVTSGSGVGTYLTGGGDGANATIAMGTTARFARVLLTIPPAALSAAVHIYAAPAGTAGAGDYFRIGPAAVIAGASAKPFSALA